MNLEIELPNVYRRYAPRLHVITVHHAAWIAANDPFLSETEKETLQNYVGSIVPWAGNPDGVRHLERIQMSYAACYVCECMTTHCKCGACSVCVFVARDFKGCARCTTSIEHDVALAADHSGTQLFASVPITTDVCNVCGFRSLSCSTCDECTHCDAERRSCGECTTTCGVCCEHSCCTSCKAFSEDALCLRCGECTECCSCAQCEKCCEPFETVCSRCDRCTDDGCCECAHCDHCGQAFEFTCSDCNRCDNHCECMHCGDCGEAIDTDHDDYCSNCGRCSSCGHDRHCDRDNDDEEGDAGDETELEGDHFNATHAQQRRHFNSTRLAGVEVEYNRCDTFSRIADWRRKWKAAHHDDASCGYECVTSPASGDLLVNQITELATAMRNADATIDKRCGIHVHVDARDLKWPDIYRLVKVYAKVETALYLIAGQHRSVRPAKTNGTHYCAPNGQRLRMGIVDGERDSARKKHHLLSAIYNGDGSTIARNKPDKKSGARYVGLNLCPWVTGRAHRAEYSTTYNYATGRYPKKQVQTPMPDTTIEFRMHRDSLDGARIAGWAKLCVRLVEYAAKATDAEIDNLPESAMRALCVIAPDLAPWIVGRLRAWRRAVPREKRRVKYTEWCQGNVVHTGWQYVFCTPQFVDTYLEEQAA